MCCCTYVVLIHFIDFFVYDCFSVYMSTYSVVSSLFFIASGTVYELLLLLLILIVGGRMSCGLWQFLCGQGEIYGRVYKKKVFSIWLAVSVTPVFWLHVH